MPKPLVTQYLYVHGQGERFEYPSSRAHGGAARLARRYLECVLVQAASLRLREGDPAAGVDLALVTNLRDRAVLGRAGVRLLEAIEAQGVQLLSADYDHRPRDAVMFAASRYVFDAIEAAAAAGPPERELWLTDVDCVWADPGRVRAAAPAPGAVGCLKIAYPDDWEMFGFTPATLRDLATEMGARADEPMRWVGGELLAGTAADLRALVAACDALEEEIAARGAAFTTEEQAVTLAGRLGRVELHDLSPVAWRLWTGPRHHAPVPDDPGALGLWHLPAEKGLGFRRTAGELLAGRPGPFARDLRDRERLMRRFNVAGTGLARRVRDDAWIASQRLRDRAAAARAARRAGDTLRP